MARPVARRGAGTLSASTLTAASAASQRPYRCWRKANTRSVLHPSTPKLLRQSAHSRSVGHCTLGKAGSPVPSLCSSSRRRALTSLCARHIHSTASRRVRTRSRWRRLVIAVKCDAHASHSKKCCTYPPIALAQCAPPESKATRDASEWNSSHKPHVYPLLEGVEPSHTPHDRLAPPAASSASARAASIAASAPQMSKWASASASALPPSGQSLGSSCCSAAADLRHSARGWASASSATNDTKERRAAGSWPSDASARLPKPFEITSCVARSSAASIALRNVTPATDGTSSPSAFGPARPPRTSASVATAPLPAPSPPPPAPAARSASPPLSPLLPPRSPVRTPSAAPDFPPGISCAAFSSSHAITLSAVGPPLGTTRRRPSWGAPSASRSAYRANASAAP
mmetsp:Transcript_3483/g.14087  ORF Transcript_3483/g.14087 Transcript_3483/m.14087 type:complete len:401 (+) Transcript_3483:188-1390(+)